MERDGFLFTLLGIWFFQVNYWNSNVNEVQGVVIDQEGKAVHRLFGKWHEGLYCGVAPSAKCVWRPGEAPMSVSKESTISDRGKGNVR